MFIEFLENRFKNETSFLNWSFSIILMFLFTLYFDTDTAHVKQNTPYLPPEIKTIPVNGKISVL